MDSPENIHTTNTVQNETGVFMNWGIYRDIHIPISVTTMKTEGVNLKESKEEYMGG